MGSPNPERYPPKMADHIRLRDWIRDHPAWAIGVNCDRCINGPQGSLIIDYELVVRVK